MFENITDLLKTIIFKVIIAGQWDLKYDISHSDEHIKEY